MLLSTSPLMVYVPSTMPTARARKTATIETMWYRKSTTLEVLSDPEDEAVPARVQDADVRLTGRRDRRRDDQCHQGRGNQKEQRTGGDACTVEPADAFRIHELAADAQPGEERARHAGAALVQELDEGRVRADRDEQARALVVGEQHRDVFTRARGRERHRRQAEVLDPLHPGCATV